MPAEVKLTILEGELEGREFVYAKPCTLIVGRTSDCSFQLPDRRRPAKVSRRHCQLDVNPPNVEIRDLGSRNGTKINGQLIGKRTNELPDEIDGVEQYRGYTLNSGDEVQVGPHLLRIDISIPQRCQSCRKEFNVLPGMPASTDGLCPTCLAVTTVSPSFNLSQPICTQCKRPIPEALHEADQGEAICEFCASDPLSVAYRLVEAANNGVEPLQSLKGYQLQHRLGQGAMGAVYLLEPPQNQDLLALKIMLPSVSVLPEFRERFKREVLNCRALSHPQIVKIHDSGYYKGVFFFTMEYCQGGNLWSLVKGRGEPLPIDEAAEILFQALDGLGYAHHAEVPIIKLADGDPEHGRGVIHRDIKPQNLLLTGSKRPWQVKLADFGLAKSFGLSSLHDLTKTGTTQGLPYFSPRQQVIDFKRSKPDADVWAMAATFYYMITGAYPREFPKGPDPWTVVWETEPVPVLERNPKIPTRVAEFLDNALIDDPNIRYQSVAEFRAGLDEAMNG